MSKQEMVERVENGIGRQCNESFHTTKDVSY